MHTKTIYKEVCSDPVKEGMRAIEALLQLQLAAAEAEKGQRPPAAAPEAEAALEAAVAVVRTATAHWALQRERLPTGSSRARCHSAR